jgi:phospholipid/cholesterol/gamma-HCH transport system substrate-binding protein
VRRLGAALAATALLAACGPATAERGGYQVTVLLADALDLAPGAPVTVAGEPAGAVQSVRLVGFTAAAQLRLNPGVTLPANAVAEVRQTSLLGTDDRTIDLAPPVGAPPAGRLADGAVIPLDHSGGALPVEEVLTAISALLTGGGLEQLRTISTELSAALGGREQRVRTLLADLERVVAGLDAQRTDIVRALASLDRLTGALAAQRRTIATALDSLAPGLKVLADQRAQLTAMLRALARLGDVAGRVVTGSRDATLADLRALTPILAELRRAGTALPDALELLASYPFPANASGAVAGGTARLYTSAVPDPAAGDHQQIDRPDHQQEAHPGVPSRAAHPHPTQRLTDLLLGAVLG